MTVHEKIEALFAAHGRLQVLVDTSVEGVSMPIRQRFETLRLSVKFRGPMYLTAEYLTTVLNFCGQAREVLIPWKAIAAAGPWEEDSWPIVVFVPPSNDTPPPPPEAPKPSRPMLRLVTDEGEIE